MTFAKIINSSSMLKEYRTLLLLCITAYLWFVMYLQLIQSNFLLSATRSQNKDTCLTSKSECFNLIYEFSKTQPRLISLVREVPNMASHPKSGKPYKVPNIVHLINFGNKQPFLFYNYVVYKSIDKYIRPMAIFVWGDQLPDNTESWWMRTLQEVPNIYHVVIQPQREIGGKKVRYIAHASDYLRLAILKGKECNL